MKKVFVLAVSALSLVACNSNSADSVTDDTVVTTNETTMDEAPAYTAQDGDVVYRSHKVMIMKNGEWVESDKEVTFDNGVVVNVNGKAIRDGKEIELEEGQVVNRTGNFFDKSGHAMEHAWDDTKEGVKDAGNAVGNAVNKVGDKIGDAFDSTHH